MREIEIDEIKTNLRDYLERQGIDTSKAFCCINPNHNDTNPSMKYFNDNKVYCFGCGETYDLFGAISAIENLNRHDAFLKAIDYYGSGKIEIKQNYNKNDEILRKNTKDYTNAYNFWHSNLKKCKIAQDYLKLRGFHPYIAEKFNLGFNEFNFAEQTFAAIVIPINEHSFTARNIDLSSNFRYYKSKNATSEIFNKVVLTNSNSFCAITEGEFDAMCFDEADVNAIALGSACNINKFINAEKAPKTYILALDNDEAGRKATEELKTYFRENKIRFVEFDNLGYKDANEAFRENKEEFKDAIKKVIEREIRKTQNQEME